MFSVERRPHAVDQRNALGDTVGDSLASGAKQRRQRWISTQARHADITQPSRAETTRRRVQQGTRDYGVATKCRIEGQARIGDEPRRAIRLVGPQHGGGAVLLDIQVGKDGRVRSEEHTSELQSLMRISYAVFCLKKKKNKP